MCNIIENDFQLTTGEMLSERTIIAALRQRGYRITSQRRAVVGAIAVSRDHLTPAELYERVKLERPDIGLVTIYRTLEILSDVGLVCELHSGGSCRSYLLRRPAEHHHHLLCAGCGQVVDFTDCGLSQLEQRLADDTGFEMESHLLEFLGRCPECQGA